MDREQLMEFISEEYSVYGDYPWMKSPNYVVYRHRSNRKWFAIIMDISESKLGLEGERIIDILNIKCDPLLVNSLLYEKGFYPAYHMNKKNWITVILDGVVDDDTIKWLIDMSYESTRKNKVNK